MLWNKIKSTVKPIVLLLMGGTIYYLIEILWRGYSHISMFILGGLCFVLIGAINDEFSWDMSLVKQSLIGTGIVTLLEFATGIIVNLKLGLNVWDYSNMPFNLLGQVCLQFVLAWIPLSCVAIILDDYLRYWLFNEEKPHYTLFSK